MAFLGMVGSDDWADNIRPEDWTAHLFREYPDGGMFNEGAIPLTGFSALMGNSKLTTDPKFHWWNKALATQATDVTAVAVYTDAAMANVLGVSTTVAYTVLYAKVPLVFAQECVPGYKIVLIETDDDRSIMRALIMAVEENGANSKLTIKTLMDDTSVDAYSLLTADRIIIMGSSFAEGTGMPEAMHYDPNEFYNYTGIAKNAIEQTGTALATEQRTADDYEEDKREQGELHEIGKEWDSIFGNRYKTTGANGKPLRGARGVLEYLTSNITSGAADSFQKTDFRTEDDYAGMSWVAGGSDWINNFLVQFAVWGPSEVFALCGNYVIKAIADVAEYLGWNELTTRQMDFGISVTTWVTPYGELHFKPHPLFMREESLKRACLIGTPKNMIKRYLKGRDTTFLEDVDWVERQAGELMIDAIREGWRTEHGYQFNMPRQWAWLNGFGINRDV